MLQYTVIATDDEHYKLSAIIKNGKYVMPSLECTVDGVSLWCWDNDDYLINTLFPILKGESGFKEIENDIPIEDFKDILNLFEEAVKMQFFNCA